MDIELRQILTQIIAFLLMLWILKRFAWKPLLGIMEERKQKIQSEFEAIETEKMEIQHLTNEYQDKLRQIEAESRAKIQEAIKQGNDIALQIQNDAQKQAKSILNKAQSEIEKELMKSKVQLKNELIEMTMTIAEKMIHDNLNTAKQRKLIAEFVDQDLSHD
jgi:F-type H+-transporting ATPase subunit b